MKLFLCDISAARWWAHALSRGAASNMCGREVFSDCAPNAKSIAFLKKSFPQVEPPLHFLVPRKQDNRAFEGCKTHVLMRDLSALPFIRVAAGLYVCSPELCFVQAACSQPFAVAAKLGMALCGTFCEDAASETGLTSRAPLTSVAQIERFMCENPGLRGLSKARRVLPYVLDNSASPRESDLALRLCLPGSEGGFGVKLPQLNHRIDMPRRARAASDQGYYVADLCWPDERLVVEYDSDLHLTASYQAHDSSKRRDLEAAGYKVVTVTRIQLNSTEEMRRIARDVSAHFGRRLRSRSVKFEEAQRELYRLC